MSSNPKKKKIVNGENEQAAASKPAKENTEKHPPLAPFDPRNKKPGEPLQAKQDPLNGVNE